MISKILLGLAAVLAILVVVILMRPDDFKVTRSATMAATPQAVFDQINDFHQWDAWSPWKQLDPDAKITFDGPQSGKGAVFKWAGNSNAGEGQQTIEESIPGELIRIRLEFIKPFPGVSQTEFTFKPEGANTQVTWTMSGENNFMAKAMSLVIDCDKMMGGFFEEGLASIKRIVETAPKV